MFTRLSSPRDPRAGLPDRRPRGRPLLRRALVQDADRAVQHRLRPRHPQAEVEEDRHDVPARADPVRRLRRDPRHEHRRGRRSRGHATRIPNRPAWQRFVTIFAGPATNYLSAIVLAIGALHLPRHRRPALVRRRRGDRRATTRCGKLEPDDRILAVNGAAAVSLDRGPTLDRPGHRDQGRAAAGSRSCATARSCDVTITAAARQRSPRASKPRRRRDRVAPLTHELVASWPTGSIGVSPIGSLESACRRAGCACYPVEQTKLIGAGLYGIVFGNEKADLGGPIAHGRGVHAGVLRRPRRRASSC